MGFVVDDTSGETLNFTVLYGGDAASVLDWLAPYVEAMGVEVLVTDGHATYGVVASALGLAHQLCLAHVRKGVARQLRAITAQASAAGDDAQLRRALTTIRTVVTELPADGLVQLRAPHQRCLANTRPELGLDGTNNAAERAISKSTLRYKTMRGYKSMAGLHTGIALTQWLYHGDVDHDVAPIIAA